jgi:hypothetical protein
MGQVINVPVDVNTMVTSLPRQLDDDHAFNVNIKRQLVHKSTYLSGFVKKSVVKVWLRFLLNQPLYKLYNIQVDWTLLDMNNSSFVTKDNNKIANIDSLDVEQVHACEMSVARQHTLLWDEDCCLNIAPGQNSIPMNLIYDRHAEELSFPAIYYGQARIFNKTVNVTPYMMATSEIRRRDRRGVTPQHILYMAMKILRMRIVDGIQQTFRCVNATTNITRKQIEDRQFVEECVEKNFAFLKSLPNSVVYWQNRRNDLFAMLRQLGKPTMFLTMSANEVRWPNLVCTLHRLNDYYKHIADVTAQNVLDKLTISMRSHLVNEDPVVCCVYFNKLVGTIMSLLQRKGKFNPFGEYSVKDYFIRIEFQHRGSPHAHILLWLENDPREHIDENMPRTIQLLRNLCSVSSDYIGVEKIKNQVHQHTFTCFKRGETTCRFNIPYWPIRETRILLPMAKSDTRKKIYQSWATKLKNMLEKCNYTSFDVFLTDNNLSYLQYLDVIRASLRRPMVIFKRDMADIYTNTFHPWIASMLNSNMDLQIVLDEYSCAQYVVEYVNKYIVHTNIFIHIFNNIRGISNLHRELLIFMNKILIKNIFN